MKTVVEVQQLNKSYKKRKTKEIVTAVNDVSFKVNKGEIIGLLGPNGAGKTTIIKMICGLLIPDSGFIKINNMEQKSNRLRSLEHISSVLEGSRNLYWQLTVRENLEYFAGNRGFSPNDVKKDIEELLANFRLKDRENEPVNRLSRGMQQKLAIAVAMLADGEVIILDEPTLGLDVGTGYEVRELLKDMVEKHQRTIIISSHDMEVIQDLCDRTIIINGGKVVTDDKVENLLNLFEVRSYVVTLGEQLTNKQLEQLQAQFPVLKYMPNMDQPTLEVNLYQSEAIYDLFDILKENQTSVESIDRKTINFEKVFMKIVKGEHLHEVG